jgi:hypothetical protein
MRVTPSQDSVKSDDPVYTNLICLPLALKSRAMKRVVSSRMKVWVSAHVSLKQFLLCLQCQASQTCPRSFVTNPIYCDDSLHLSLKTSCSQLLLVLVYNGGVAVQVVPSQRLDLRQTRLGSATHAKIPEIARSMPNTDRSFAFLPLVAHPRATMEHVLMCPTTVLLTAPAPATMKNCEMLIRLAITPL